MNATRLVSARWRRIILGATLVAVLPLIPLTRFSTAGALTTLGVGANVNISRLAGNQSEATVAVNPTNPNNVVVVSNVAGGNGLFKAMSTNGGATWAGTIIANGDALGTACCDPSAAFDSFGNLFLTYIDSATTNIQVARSTDGGATFTFVSTVGTGNVDQPTLTTGPGSVWVTHRASDGNIAATGAAVTGLGTMGAFNTPEEAPGSAGGNFGDIAIGPAGQVLVTYQIPSGGQGPATVFVGLDSDGLGPGGFGPAVSATSTNVGGFDFIPAQSSRSVDAEAGLAWDRSGGARNGRVYLVYTDETPDESNNLDIFVRFSDNNGAAWSAPVRVNDDAGTNSQFLPRIALDQTTGNIAVSWYDARNDTGSGPGSTNGTANDDAQFFATVSTDGGATFLPNVQVSAGTSNAADAQNGIDFGDYTGQNFQSGSFYPVWADNSNSTGDNPNGTLSRLDLYTARVTVRTNTPPTANAGGPYSGIEGAAIDLTGAAASDPENDPLTYAWSVTSAPVGASCSFDNANTLHPNLTCDEEGSYIVQLSVSDGVNPAVTSQATVTVADAPLAATGLTLTSGSGTTFSGVVATFSDADPNGTVSDYSATIDWGDGQTSSGTIGTSGSGFSVSGSHTYAALGPYTVQVTIKDVGGSQASATTHLLIFAYPAAGAFALGDKTVAAATSRTTVTWWGANWSTLNSLSGGSAPAAFKGFAKTLRATPPVCGGTWTTTTGNSSMPPSSVPTYMGVVVPSTITKSGSTISGNIVQIVVVKTNAGYAPDPGHLGTSTIVGTVCR